MKNRCSAGRCPGRKPSRAAHVKRKENDRTLTSNDLRYPDRLLSPGARVVRLGSAVVATLVAIFVLRGVSAGRRPNVLLVTLDTVRADRTGPYGYTKRATTPFLDALARRAMVFDGAVTSTPFTTPTHASFLTGRGPLQHGVLLNAMFLPAETTTKGVAAAFRSAGYRTGGFVSSVIVSSRFGFQAGFDHYDDSLDVSLKGKNAFWEKRLGIDKIDRDGSATVDRALAWIREPNPLPWFAWVHLFDAHEPYVVPSPFDRAFEAPGAPLPPGPALTSLRYDQEILYVDSLCRRLVAGATKDRPDTLVVLVSDHGEGLGDRGELNHGKELFSETTRLFLVVAGRDIPSGRTALPASPESLGRALLEIAGRGSSWKGLPSFADTSKDQVLLGLLPAPWPGEPRPEDGTRPTVRVGLRAGALRLLGEASVDQEKRQLDISRESRWQLYDLSTDPGETRDLAPERPGVVLDLQRRLASRLEEGGWAVATSLGAPRDESATKALRALGYLN